MRKQDKQATTSIQRLGAAITLSVLAGCAGFSTSSIMSSGSSSDERVDDEKVAADATSSDRDKTVFAGLTEEENKKQARDFKRELRTGELADLFKEGKVFDEVAAVCGVKLWDKCRVNHVPGVKVRNYYQWAYQLKEGGEIHWYPDIFEERTEPFWAKKAVADVLMRGPQAPVIVNMLEERCGSPLDTGCKVQRVKSTGYVLTVRDTGEVIDIWKTIQEWEKDL